MSACRREDLDFTAQLIIDGTLFQCWSWAGHPELYLSIRPRDSMRGSPAPVTLLVVPGGRCRGLGRLLWA